MSRKILNPYIKFEGYNCYACAPGNEYGLKMEFLEEGDEVVSKWQPADHFQGYHHILHGGVQATLMDEIASWIIQVKLKTGGMTSALQTRFKKPVYTNKGEITVRARIGKVEKRLVHVNTFIFDHAGELCSEGVVTYFVFPEKLARRQLFYPGVDAFFDDQS